MSNLVVIVPSRGRPENAAELVRVFNNKCSTNTELVFAVDDNDPTLPEYQRIVNGLTLKVRVSIGIIDNPSTMVRALNQAAAFIANKSESFAIGFMGDDHRPQTYGWDQAYLDALHELGTGIVYGDDLVQGKKLPTQCAMTSDIVRELGFMAPPNLRHMYVDNFWRDLGKASGCLRYLPDVIIQHQHPVAGTAEWDDGYRRVNDHKVYAEDEAAYRLYCTVQLDKDVERVRALLPEPKHEWQLFPTGTIPEYTTPEWYLSREHAPHLEEVGHRDRLMTSATLVAQAAFAEGLNTVVDLGAGDGGLLSLLGPNLKTWGYDLAPKNLDAAKKRGVDIRLADVINDDLEWGQIAVCTEMLEHLVDPHAFVRKIARHSKVLVASSPRLENAQSHYEFHTWAWDLDGYRALIEQAGFVVKRQQRVHGFQVVMAVKP